jgi:hypothetical protein
MALIVITASANAQLKVKANGEVTINAQTQNWWPALRITVPTQLSCAYNLWNTYYNQDVFYVRGDGVVWTQRGVLTASDISLKTNITLIEGALGKVKKLQGVRYQYKEGEGENGEEDFRLGFIAQEVEKVCPEVVKEAPDGIKAMSYSDLIALLVEAVKEQQTQIEKLQNTVSKQANEMIILKEQVEAFYQRNSENEIQNSMINSENIMQNKEAKLFQNTPNPFSMNTEIKFEIPENATSAKLLIHDMQGAEIKSYSITAKGVGNIIIQGAELSAGMNMYTLLVNNNIVDSKRMILTK